MSNQDTVTSLLNEALPPGSSLLTAMQQLVADVYRGYNAQFPAPVSSTNLFTGGALSTTSDVQNFTGGTFPTNLHLSWDAVLGAQTYEIRYHLGPSTNFDTAIFLLQTNTLQADISPITIPLVFGLYTFLIKAIDGANTYSNNAASFQFTLPAIGGPVVTPTVIGNNVLLKWVAPDSLWQIAYYEIQKSGVTIGTIAGTFDVLFELLGGTYSYDVIAVDIVGNIGSPSAIVTVTLSDPPDFTFLGSITSTLNGTKVKCCLDSDGTLFAPINITESYQDHFINNSYTDWQDPITAGFPLYFEPGPNSAATYTETFDFGTIVDNIILTVDWNTTRINGTVGIGVTIAVSTDNITFDAPVSGTSRFATAIRYAKVVVTFTPSDASSSLNFYNFRCVANIRFDTDQGSIAALSTDVSGTVVTFNKTFKKVLSVTLVPQTNVTANAVYNNLSTSGFNVFVFDNSGSRLSKTVTWIARGNV